MVEKYKMKGRTKGRKKKERKKGKDNKRLRK